MNNLPLRPDDLAALRILEEIERRPDTTQRELSRQAGVSLGLTNALIRRMARKAWIKIRNVPGSRVLYALTPRGLAEKVRKTAGFVRSSVRYYVTIKRELAERIQATGARRPGIASFGAGDAEPLVVESAQSVGGRYLGEVGAVRLNGQSIVVVALCRPPKEKRDEWARCGFRVVEMY